MPQPFAVQTVFFESTPVLEQNAWPDGSGNTNVFNVVDFLPALRADLDAAGDPQFNVQPGFRPEPRYYLTWTISVLSPFDAGDFPGLNYQIQEGTGNDTPSTTQITQVIPIAGDPTSIGYSGGAELISISGATVIRGNRFAIAWQQGTLVANPPGFRAGFYLRPVAA